MFDISSHSKYTILILFSGKYRVSQSTATSLWECAEAREPTGSADLQLSKVIKALQV